DLIVTGVQTCALPIFWRSRAVARSRRNVASSESPLSLGYRDPQYRADTVLRSPRIAEEARLRCRDQWRYAGRTLRLRSQGVLWHRLSDEKKNLPSPTGRPFRTRTLGRLDRSGSVCP